MRNDIVKQLREIADTLEGCGTNSKELEITEDEIHDLRWCIDEITSIIKYEGRYLTECSQDKLVEVNKYLSRIWVRNLHL